MELWRLVLASAALALACGAAAAAEFHETITFREPLGHTWTDELVHYEVKPAGDRVAATTFSLTDADGKPAPIQIEVLDGKPDAVRRARIWLKVTLASQQEVFYRLTWNDEARPAARPDDGVMVRREGDRLVLSTGAAEALLAAPLRPFAPPLEFKNAPMPILAARPAGDRAWCGQWAAAGGARVREIKTAVVATGPLWAEVRFAYVFDGGGRNYDVTVRAVRGEPWIDVLEKYRLPEGTMATLVLAEPLNPAEALWMPWFVGRDGRVEPAYDVRRIRLAEVGRSNQPLATLRPLWNQVRDTSQVCLAGGPGEGRPAVGAAMTSAGDWQKPYDQFVTVRAPDGGRAVAMDFPLADGRRHWALLAGPVARFDSKAELQLLIRRNADIPLDRVLNEWVLQWPPDPGNPAPHILTTWERLEEIRGEMAAGIDSPTVRLIKRAAAGDAPGDRRLAEFLAGRREDLGGPPGTDAVLGRAYQDEALAPPAYARRVAAAIRLWDLSLADKAARGAAAAFFAYVFSDPNFRPASSAGWGPGTGPYDIDMYTPIIYAWTMMPDHPHAPRWMASGLAALREDVRRLAPAPDGAGPDGPGQQAAALAPRLALARTVQHAGGEDPFRWPEVWAGLEFLRNLHTPPDPRLGRRGLAFGEAAAGQDAVGAMFGVAAAGARDAAPHLSAHWMAMYRHYYGDGGSGDLARDVLLADPAAPAARLGEASWASRAYAGFGAVLRSRFGSAAEAFAALRCGGAPGASRGDELSFHFFGAGMPVALDFGCGKTPRVEQEHMHNRVNLGADENMDAAGELLAMETSPAADVAVGQVKSDRLRRMPRYPHEITRASAFSRRTLPSESRYRRYLLLVKHPQAAGGSADAADTGGPASGLEDYLVIRDELASTEPATFNLHVLARAVRQDGRLFVFDGQLAADAVLYMATPEPERVQLDRWAWPRQDESSMIPREFHIGTDRWRTGELQQHVRITESPGRPFLAVLYPYRKGAAVPEIETLAAGRGVRVTLGEASEEVYLSTDPPAEARGQAAIHRDGLTTVLLKPKAVPPM